MGENTLYSPSIKTVISTTMKTITTLDTTLDGFFFRIDFEALFAGARNKERNTPDMRKNPSSDSDATLICMNK
jgi:hypothetical protein